MQPKPRFTLLLLLCCLLRIACGSSERSDEVLLLISCPAAQPQALPNCLALRESLRQQQRQLATATAPIPQDYVIKVHIMHELFNYWTLLDALPHLRGETRLLNARTSWIIWCQPNTHVSSLRVLLEQLQRQNAQELAYYGHGLRDAEATIIHHFAHYKNPSWFPYPMLSAGVVFTGRLLRRMAELVALHGHGHGQNSTRHSEFAIDAAHELARFIFDNLTPDDASQQLKATYNGDDDGDGDISQHKIILKSAAYICPSARMSAAAAASAAATSPTAMSSSSGMATDVHCVLHAKPEAAQAVLPSTGGAVDCLPTTSAHIYFAIKTCAKFHKERIPIIERTWAPDAVHRRYYSDVADSGIPTFRTGIPNVETGHCAKTLAILQLSLKDIGERMQRQEEERIRWLLLVDDDTLLSVPRLSSLLSCYNHTSHIYLGERYGYRLHASDGFNYHTGGAGIAFSLPLVRLIVRHCSCPAAAAPDDMILGYCLQALGIPALHSAGFHQARPQDYAPALLRLTPPISFHKFEHTSPERTFRLWLGGGERAGGNTSLRLAAGGASSPPFERLLPGLLHVGVAPGFDTASKHLDL